MEYEIQLEELQIFEQDGRSLAVIKVVFRRNMEYHVTNVFLQTFVLVSVGYLTFFFRFYTLIYPYGWAFMFVSQGGQLY